MFDRAIDCLGRAICTAFLSVIVIVLLPFILMDAISAAYDRWMVPALRSGRL